MIWEKCAKTKMAARNSDLLAYCFFVIVAASLGGRFTSSIQPDSVSYLNFYSTRTSLYPFFLEIVLDGSNFYNFLGLIQLVVFLITFYLLILAIKKAFLKNRGLFHLFAITYSLNVYLHSFHSQILTESITFSVINILMLFFLMLTDNKSWKPVLGIGFCVGMLVGLKPAMAFLLPVTPVLLFVIFFEKKQFFVNLLVIFLIGVSVPIVAEYKLYHLKYEQRNSVVHLTTFGKAAIISTHPDFVIPKLSPEQNQWMLEIDQAMEPFQAWKETGPNIFVQGTVSSYMEVMAQYQLSGYIISNKNLPKLSREERLQMSLKVLRVNLGSFSEEIFTNFINMWGVGTLEFFAHNFAIDLPRFNAERLDAHVPKIGKEGAKHKLFAKISLFTFPGFLILGLITLCAWIISVIQLVSNNGKFKSLENQINFVFGSIVITGVTFVAITNIPMPRYLMPFFPMSLLISAFSISKLMGCLKKFLPAS